MRHRARWVGGRFVDADLRSLRHARSIPDAASGVRESEPSEHRDGHAGSARGPVHRLECIRQVVEADGRTDRLRGQQPTGHDVVEHRRVLPHGDPVAAEQFELVGGDAAHRDRRRRLVVEQEADLHVPTPGTQRRHGRNGRGPAPVGVDRNVGTTVGQPVDRRRRLVVHHQGARPQRGGTVERRCRDVDGDDPGPRGDGDDDRRQSHAAAAVDDDPLPWCHPTAGMQCVVRGAEAAPESGGLGEPDRVRQVHEVHVGVRDHHGLRVRALQGEAGLLLARAHLGRTVAALVARAAREDEGRGDPVPHDGTGDGRPDGGDDPGELVPRDVGQAHGVVVAPPGVPVAAAHAGRRDPDDDAVVRGDRLGELDDRGGGTEPVVLDCAHGAILADVRRRARGRATALPALDGPPSTRWARRGRGTPPSARPRRSSPGQPSRRCPR
ncbi:hypothetical protein Cus16_0342 [Curtobacterium sp. ER1/6]|nr:hypothetical protein Cus16_0342 [Curtobacterium sp. ER1/6]